MIVVQVAGNWSGYDSVYLGERIQNDLETRGIPSDLLATDPLSLDAPDINREIETCGFDHVLILFQTTEKTMNQGLFGDSPRGFVFDVRLMRVADAEILWRGNLDASGNADSRRTYINSLVKMLMERLETDRVVTRPLDDSDKPEKESRKEAGSTPR